MQKTPLLVFDLDDTLYDELDYVMSGFLAVANFLEETRELSSKKTFKEMKEILEKQGRGLVFDTLLKNHHLYSKKLVKECLSVYRHHIPQIKIYPDANRLFKRYKDRSLFIVTDGHKIVQDNKIEALHLKEKMEHCYLTNRYGNKNAKPSPYCFILICKRKNVSPRDIVYIADNPYKDFVGLKTLGFQTIRILRGRYRDVKLGKEHEADRTITTLDEL